MKKKFFSLLGILAIIAISNCSRVPENDDPILGVWSKTSAITNEGKQASQREEWIFNDAYLGRYHSFNNNKLEFYTDFNWTIDDGVYTIEYRGENLEFAKVELIQAADSETLHYETGGHFASRE